MPGDATQPGLAAYVRAGLDARAPDDRGPQAMQGLVVSYLELRPPAAVLDLPTAPSPYLSPEQFGRRLEGTGEETSWGVVYSDRLTGQRWEASTYSRQQAGHVVAAAALYNVLGVLAPEARLVMLDDGRYVAHLELKHWHKPNAGVDVSENLEVERAADVWLRNTRVPLGVRVRRHRIEGMSAHLRADLTGCLGYSSWGRLDHDWGMDVDDITEGAGATVHVPMLRRVTSVSETTIARACEIADLPPDSDQSDEGAAWLCELVLSTLGASSPSGMPPADGRGEARYHAPDVRMRADP